VSGRAVLLRRALSLAWCVFAVSATATAQVAAGSVTGVLTDQAHAPVRGATVTLTNIATNIQRVAASTSDGVYAIEGLVPGTYRIDVQLQGFKPIRREGVDVVTGQTSRIDLALSVGSLQELVTVVANGPMVRSETASLGMVVEHDKVVQLPLNG